MLTIFTIPKRFHGLNNIIQRNAIQSWLSLRPKCEIILFGDDEGVADTALEFGVKHQPCIRRNGFGTPLLDSAFSSAQAFAKNDILVYANSDVMFFDDIVTALEKLELPSFLISGRRWDLDLSEELVFSDVSWAANVRAMARAKGKLHGYSGKDYFIFKRHTVKMLPFAVGRPGWDDWLVYNFRMRNIPVINATEAITVIHQNHDYSHSAFGVKDQVVGPERAINVRIAGGLANMMTLKDANWVLDSEGLKRPKINQFLRSIVSRFHLWRYLLGVIRKVQHPDLRGV